VRPFSGSFDSLFGTSAWLRAGPLGNSGDLVCCEAATPTGTGPARIRSHGLHSVLEEQVQYRPLPKHPSVRLSTLGFGCMRLPVVGGDYRVIDEDQACKLVRRAIDAGVNYVDTAYPYHGGESESFLGRALRDGYRSRTYVATKAPTFLVSSAADWERFLEEQLRKLDCGAIDFYLLHGLNAERWEQVKALGGLGVFERARADARIRFVGFSFHGSPEAFSTIVEAYDWDLCLVQYNVVDEEYQAGIAGLRRAAARRVGVAVMEPLRGGGLARVPEGVDRIWRRSPVARSAAEWALRWIWDHAEVTTVLSGMNSESQLRENLELAARCDAGAMSAEEVRLVEEVREFYRARVKVGCTTCGYCVPCPNGVSIPDVFSLYNDAAMFDSRDRAGWAYRAMLASRGHAADACLECGTCEGQCPQAIPIPDKLKEAHAHLTEK
jgi:uncharacterized protein